MEALGPGLWLRRETGAGQFTVGKLSITVTRSEIRLCSRHHNLIEDQMSVPADERRITILRGGIRSAWDCGEETFSKRQTAFESVGSGFLAFCCCTKSDQAAINSAAISGPTTKPLIPISEIPPTVEIKIR